MLLFCPSWSCTIIYCIIRFTSLCKNFLLTWNFSRSFSMPCASFSMLDGPIKHWTLCTWHQKASAKTSSKLNKFLHSEVNLLIQHIIVQDQDGQNNNIKYKIELSFNISCRCMLTKELAGREGKRVGSRVRLIPGDCLDLSTSWDDISIWWQTWLGVESGICEWYRETDIPEKGAAGIWCGWVPLSQS